MNETCKTVPLYPECKQMIRQIGVIVVVAHLPTAGQSRPYTKAAEYQPEILP